MSSYYSDILRIGFHQVCISGGTISRMLERQGMLVAADAPPPTLLDKMTRSQKAQAVALFKKCDADLTARQALCDTLAASGVFSLPMKPALRLVD